MNPSPMPPRYDLFSAVPTVRLSWIGTAWKLFTARSGLWVGVVFFLLAVSAMITFGIVIIAAFLDHSNSSSSGDASFSWDILMGGDVLIGSGYLLCTFLLSPAAYGMAVRQAHGEPINWEDLFRIRPVFGRMLGYELLAGALILAGLALAVIPGLLLAGLLLPAPALIADGAGVFEAMSRSIGVMSRGWLPAIGLVLLLGAMLGIGLVPCGLGLLAAQPLVWLLSAVAYRETIGLPHAATVAPRDYEFDPDAVWPPPPRANPDENSVTPPPPPPTMF